MMKNGIAWKMIWIWNINHEARAKAYTSITVAWRIPAHEQSRVIDI